MAVVLEWRSFHQQNEEEYVEELCSFVIEVSPKGLQGTETKGFERDETLLVYLFAQSQNPREMRRK